LVAYAVGEHGLSERQACQMLKMSRSAYRYRTKKPDDEEIKQVLLEVADRKPRWGFRKMVDYLKNQGYVWNHKRIRRVYCELSLNLRVKPKKGCQHEPHNRSCNPRKPTRVGRWT